MSIVITGNNLTIEKVVRVARNNEKVELFPEAKEKIKKFGNETLTILEEIKKNPEAKGVKILK